MIPQFSPTFSCRNTMLIFYYVKHTILTVCVLEVVVVFFHQLFDVCIISTIIRLYGIENTALSVVINGIRMSAITTDELFVCMT